MMTYIHFKDGTTEEIKGYELCRIIDGFLEAKYEDHSQYYNVDTIDNFAQFDDD